MTGLRLSASVVAGRRVGLRVAVAFPLGTARAAARESVPEVVADDVARLVARVFVVPDVLARAEVPCAHADTGVDTDHTPLLRGCLSESRQRLRSAQQNTLVIPRFRLTTYGRRAFSVAGPTAWNSLPVAFRDPTISDAFFRRHLKTVLFAQQRRHHTCSV